MLDDGELVGIVSRRDVMKGFLTFYEEQLRHEVENRQPPEMDDTITAAFIIG